MIKLVTVLFIFLFGWRSEAIERVRRVVVQGDQIVTVRTAIGIATIIQVPDKPNSVVVGDQNSFKVEYLDQAITIKPLASDAKSNLYIYTDWRRFNVELISGVAFSADYVVYIEASRERPQMKKSINASGVKWTEFKNNLHNDYITLNVKRVGRTNDGTLLIEFAVSSARKEPFNPEWIWISQRGITRPIHNLFMSALEVTPQRTLLGVIQLQEFDLNINESIRLELRRNQITYLTINRISAWKQ